MGGARLLTKESLNQWFSTGLGVARKYSNVFTIYYIQYIKIYFV